jgi:hypothetical protein
VKDHLEEEIAQFLLEVGQVVARDGVGDLIGLFERVRRDGRDPTDSRSWACATPP